MTLKRKVHVMTRKEIQRLKKLFFGGNSKSRYHTERDDSPNAEEDIRDGHEEPNGLRDHMKHVYEMSFGSRLVSLQESSPISMKKEKSL